jgi:hypothetical protein
MENKEIVRMALSELGLRPGAVHRSRLVGNRLEMHLLGHPGPVVWEMELEKVALPGGPGESPLAEKSLAELRAIARELGIKGRSKLSKSELLEALQEVDYG